MRNDGRAIVIHNDSRRIRGSERQTALIARGLTERGHRVIVSCRPGELSSELSHSGIETTPIRPRGDVDVVNAWRFYRWLAEIRPDAILLTTLHRTPFAAWAARRAGVRNIVVRLGVPRGIPERGLSRIKYDVAFRRYISALIANSEEVKDHFLTTAPYFPAESVRVVPNGVEPFDVAPAPLRAELNVPAAATLLVAVGKLEPRKGFDMLIDALALVENRHTHVVVVGGGELESVLRDRAQAAGLAQRIHWLGQRSDVRAILAASDLFVHASLRDSFSNALLEAMAAGLPAIATDTAGVRTALEGSHERRPAGWIVPVGDAAAFAQSIDAAVADRDQLRQRGGEAKYRSIAWFGVAPMVDAYERLLLQTSPAV